MENNQNQTTSPSDYNFIFGNKPKRSIFSPNSSSMKAKLVVVLGGILIIVIIFSVFNSLFNTPLFNKSDFLRILQDQSQILNITSTNLNQQIIQSSISANNSNFAAEVTLVLNSDQSSINSYLKNNGIVFTPQMENLTVSSSYITQLTNAVSANNFNPTFNTIFTSLFDSYLSDLKTAYASEKGPIGKKLLSNEYHNASMLLKMLNSPKS